MISASGFTGGCVYFDVSLAKHPLNRYNKSVV